MVHSRWLACGLSMASFVGGCAAPPTAAPADASTPPSSAAPPPATPPPAAPAPVPEPTPPATAPVATPATPPADDLWKDQLFLVIDPAKETTRTVSVPPGRPFHVEIINGQSGAQPPVTAPPPPRAVWTLASQSTALGPGVSGAIAPSGSPVFGWDARMVKGVKGDVTLVFESPGKPRARQVKLIVQFR